MIHVLYNMTLVYSSIPSNFLSHPIILYELYYFVRVIYLYIDSEDLAWIKKSWQPRQIAAEK